MNRLECRNCQQNLTAKDKHLVCYHCHSAFVDFNSLRKILRPVDFAKFENESRFKSDKSAHNCILCTQAMSLHFLIKDIHVESCFKCQKLWFDQTELTKLQKNLAQQSKGTTFKSNFDPSIAPITASFFDFDDFYYHSNNFRDIYGSYDSVHVDTILNTTVATEIVTSHVGNKISETKLFKRYPIFTFCLVMAAIIGFFYLIRPKY